MEPGHALRSPVLIGRAEEIEGLTRALDRVREGAGQTVLIAGEAGVGKSRLVAETRARAEADGLIVLIGTCFEPDQALPYAPLRDLLHPYLADVDADIPAAARTALGGDLGRLLPELGPGSAAIGAPQSEIEPGRVVVALDRFLAALSADRPLLIVVEDLHWSDEASLDVLRRLARRLARMPALLLLTYRDDEAPPALEHVLADLARERLAVEVCPRRLDRAGLAELVRAIFELDRPPGAEFLDALAPLTDGNPFLVEEVLTSLVVAGEIVPTAGGWERRPLGALRIPRTVQDSVHRRTAGLSPAARDALELAAVAGRRFDFVLLQVLTGYEEDDLLALVKELIAARLVVEESAETFAFRHALIREAVAAGLLARERVALHRRIGEAIAELHHDRLDTRVEDLAHHFFEAGDWARVLAHAPRAGNRARALGAPRAAAEQYGRAIVAAERLGLAPPFDVVRARGLARATAGDFAGALTDFTASLDLARATSRGHPDRRAEWQALLDLGFHWSERDLDRSRGYLDTALTLARDLGDPSPLAHSLNRLGNWRLNRDEPEEALRLHEEALAIFGRLDDRAGQAATHDLLSMAAGLGGDTVAAARHAEAAIALFRQFGDRQGLAGSLPQTAVPVVYEALTLVPNATLPAAIVIVEQALALAREIGWRGGEAYVLSILGGGYAGLGEFGRGLALVAEGLSVAEEIEHREWQIQSRAYLALILVDLGDLSTARAEFDKGLAAAREVGSRLWINQLAGGLAHVLVEYGDREAAEKLVAGALTTETPMRSTGQRLLWLARADLDLARGDPAAALITIDRLFATAANLTTEEQIPALALPKARALAALGQPEAAMALLLASQETARAAGARPLLRRLHAALARVYADASRPEEAAREAAAARSLAADLAPTIPDERLRQCFLDVTSRDLPAPASTDRTAGELTAREREVALRVARGRTNREIAAELFVGERTVETHVGNILAKLGFTSRTQIASWVTERGLTDE